MWISKRSVLGATIAACTVLTVAALTATGALRPWRAASNPPDAAGAVATAGRAPLSTPDAAPATATATLRAAATATRTARATKAAQAVPVALPATPAAVAAAVVEPARYGQSVACATLGYEQGMRVQPPNPGTYTIGKGTLTIEGDGRSFDWTSTVPLHAVVVRADTDNDDFHVYTYAPPALHSTGLRAPGAAGDPAPAAAYATFCFGNEDGAVAHTAALPDAHPALIPVGDASAATAGTAPSATAGVTPRATASPTPNETSSLAVSAAAGETPSATASATPSATASATPSVTPSATPSPTASATASETPSATPSPTASATAIAKGTR